MCYHLFTRAKHAELDEYQQPEMLRVPLQQLCLQVKILNLAPVGSVKHFLDKVRHRTMSSRAHPFTLPPPSLQAIDPPSSEALANAMSVLTRIGALALLPAGSGADGVATSELETLTPLGRHLAFLPMDPQLGKALLCACLFQCLDPILTITAALRYLVLACVEALGVAFGSHCPCQLPQPVRDAHQQAARSGCVQATAGLSLAKRPLRAPSCDSRLPTRQAEGPS